MLRNLKIANLHSKEKSLTVVMFIQALFVGIFMATYDIRAHAVFLTEFTNDYLAYAYVISGILGAVIFFIYSLAFKRMPLKLFAFFNYSIVAGAVVGFYFLPQYLTERQIRFLYLVAMIPLNLLLFLTYWRVSRKLFKKEQSKRVNPFLDVGLALGFILTGTGIMTSLYFFRIEILLPIVYGSVALVFVLQFFVYIIHSVKKVYNHEKERFIPVKFSLFMMFTSKYTFLLYLFGVLSSVVAFLLHFCFLVLTKETYPHLYAMTKFYALFLACLYLIILVTDKALIKKILWSYDSPYSLILIPVGIVFALVSALFLRLLFKNATPLENFTFFFILIGLAKLSYEAAKYTIQTPGARALYQTLDIRYRQIIFPRFEGSLTMIGLICAGFIIIGFYHFFPNLASEKVVIYLVLITLGITVFWFFISFRLIKNYQKELHQQIRRLRLGLSKHENISDSFEEKIHTILVGKSIIRCKSALLLSERLQPVTFEKNLQWLLSNPSRKIKEIVLDKIEQKSMFNLLPDLEKVIRDSQNGIKERCNYIVNSFNEKLKKVKGKEDIDKLINSEHIEDRILAADIIGTNKLVKYTNILINLSREFEPEVKFAAVRAMARLGSTEHSYLLIEYLNSPVFAAYAYEALIQIGEPALDFLERAFVTPGNDDIFLSRIVRIYGKIGGIKAVELLLAKIENQNKTIANQAILSLKESKFQASAGNINRILNLIVKHIGIIAWNHLIHYSIKKKKKYALLKEAFFEELEENYQMLFDLLGLAYNANSIRKIKDLVVNGNRADISYAIELMDQFVYEDIKQVLFPVLENIPEKEKISKLQYYYPIEKMSMNELISSIITRDYNALSLYPRACAMICCMTNIKQVNQELIASLFHPNKLIRETASLIIDNLNPEILEDVAPRLEPGTYDEILQALHKIKQNENEFILTKLEILRQIEQFKKFPEDLLIELANAIEIKSVGKDEVIDINESKDELDVFYILSGAAILGGSDIQYKLKFGEVYYTGLIHDEVKSIRFVKDSELCTIRKEVIDQLIYNYPEISMNMVEFVGSSKLLTERKTA